MANSNQATRRPSAPSGDGRRRRSDDSRRRIVAAMLEIVRDDGVVPSADLVAERAGVGRRTVFRLFRDMESLYRELHGAMLTRIEHIRSMPIEGDDWRARLTGVIDRRVQLFEEIMPIKIVADGLRSDSAFLQGTHEETTRTLRQMLMFVLPKAIKDDSERFEALDATLSFEMWRRLRHEQKLSLKAARRVIDKIMAAIAA